jgi:leader peptidase (prepilin peptidase)/N-methyltransferase
VTFISSTADLVFFSIFAFLFGLVFGSFLNVCIYRLPRGLSVVSPGSACPSCNSPIAAYDNIPVLSWFILGGKCRSCKKPIASRYWIIELLTGLLFTACVLRFGVSLTALKFCIFSFLTLGLIFTDADTQLLPDALTIPGIWIGLLFAPFVPITGAAGLIDLFWGITLDWRVYSSVNAMIAAALGAGFIYAAGELWFRLRGTEGMGFGDVKLMAMVGAFLGPRLTLLTIFLGSLSGSVIGLSLAIAAYRKRAARWKHAPAEVRKAKAQNATAAIMRRFPVPFGVFLGCGALLSAFFGDTLVNCYLGMFR